jgi:hypothetical protein
VRSAEIFKTGRIEAVKPFGVPDSKEIDAEIRALISLLNERDEFCTIDSCAGHAVGNRPRHTHIGIAVRGLHGIKELAGALTAIEATLYFDGILIDCSLSWFLQFRDGIDSTPQAGWIWFWVTFSKGDGSKVTLGKKRLDRMVRILRKHFGDGGTPKRTYKRRRASPRWPGDL